MDEKLFGERLRKYREEKKVSLTFLAQQLGISAAHLSHVEQGKRGPFSFHTILKTQQILKLDDQQAFSLAYAASAHEHGLCVRLTDISQKRQGGWQILHLLLYGMEAMYESHRR